MSSSASSTAAASSPSDPRDLGRRDRLDRHKQIRFQQRRKFGFRIDFAFGVRHSAYPSACAVSQISPSIAVCAACIRPWRSSSSRARNVITISRRTKGRSKHSSSDSPASPAACTLRHSAAIARRSVIFWRRTLVTSASPVPASASSRCSAFSSDADDSSPNATGSS